MRARVGCPGRLPTRTRVRRTLAEQVVVRRLRPPQPRVLVLELLDARVGLGEGDALVAQAALEHIERAGGRRGRLVRRGARIARAKDGLQKEGRDSLCARCVLFTNMRKHRKFLP